MRHYYVKYDWTAREGNPGYGFCNAKRAVAFKSKDEANDFFEHRKGFDFSSKLIKRCEAEFLAEKITHDDGWIVFRNDYGVEIYDHELFNYAR